MPDGDDPTIPDETPLYRRIAPEWLHPDERLRCVRASSGAVQTERLSVLIGDTLVELGLGAGDIVEDWPTHALLEFAAGDARAAGLPVVRDPRGYAPLEQAHGLVLGKKSTRQKKALLTASVWVIAPPGACPTPAG